MELPVFGNMTVFELIRYGTPQISILDKKLDCRYGGGMRSSFNGEMVLI
jgi:hypothetical protein